jgi:hypothetical protein
VSLTDEPAAQIREAMTGLADTPDEPVSEERIYIV